MNDNSQIRNMKYRVHAQIHRLCINKNLDFQSQVTWRRSNNKVETRKVKHSNGFSVFNQAITLQLNMPFNESDKSFGDKNTEISAVIIFKGQVKSGGVAKLNAGSIFNENWEGCKKSIPLAKCPDPNAFLEVTFTWEKVEEGEDLSEVRYHSIIFSVLNASNQDLSISRIEFNDDKSSLEIQRINVTIKKLEQLASKTEKNQTKDKQSSQRASVNLQDITKKYQNIQRDKQTLQLTIVGLQESLAKKNNQLIKDKKKHKEEIEQLKKQLDSKDKQSTSKSKRTRQDQPQSVDHFRQLYEQSQIELIQLKEKLQLGDRKSVDFNKMMSGNFDDVKDMANFSVVYEQYQAQSQQKIEQTQRFNTELQSQVANISHKMALLFNASFEYGGPQLLDYLQTAIGLTESENQ